MSTAKQATQDRDAAHTDAAHQQQKDDPSEDANVQEGRIEKPTRRGKGVDETGEDSRAPHSRP